LLTTIWSHKKQTTHVEIQEIHGLIAVI